MSRGTRSYFIALKTLLIAVAIQGITPDAQDLASLKIFELLSVLRDLSSPWNHHDGLPHDVCTEVQDELQSVVETRVHQPGALGQTIGDKPLRP
jgi:hypothetical protein